MKSFFPIAASLLIAASATLGACRKTTEQPPVVDTPVNAAPGTVKVEFFNRVGNGPLVLNGPKYVNAAGDSFTVSRFQYYISNVQLTKTDGTVWSEPESYHLITAGSATEFDMTTVPAGSYNSISYTIGVDSTRNVSGAQTGALDPAKGMFWSWNSGYIMMKFEGTSPSSPAAGGTVMLHPGGFSGANNAVRPVAYALPAVINVRSARAQHIHLAADVLKLLNAPNQISFATTNIIHMPGAAANKLADNYAGMFTVTSAGDE